MVGLQQKQDSVIMPAFGMEGLRQLW